jgi:hypothetical protein
MTIGWTLLVALPAAWLASMLMNRSEFDSSYFLAALAGALLFPYTAALVAQNFFDYGVQSATFSGLQPRCAGALIGCLLFDAAKGFH